MTSATTRTGTRAWRGDHFGVLLVVLLALLLLSAFRRRPVLGVLDVLLVATAVVVMHRVLHGGRPGRRRWPELLEGGGLALAAITAPLAPAWSQALSAALTTGLFAWLAVRCLARVLGYGDVELRSLFGALCVYLLIGFAFAAAYRFLSALGPDAVVGSGRSGVDETYFSFVTLTTVGFGDLLPVTAAARRVAVLEAMTGQIFLATVVARLVSLFRTSAGPGTTG